MDGYFAAVLEDGPSTTIYVSPDGVTQIFYAVSNGSFYWGTNVSQVLRASGLSWQWNYDALGDVSVFGHLLGKETLQVGISRVLAGELVKWDGKSLTSTVIPPPQLTHIHGPQAAVDLLMTSVRNHSHPDDVISMSAGFDSRLILAAHLASGLKPRLLVMGPAEATDVSIAYAIAKRFDLEIQQVVLTGNWMLQDRLAISRETSGTKTIENWHTYEYVAASGHTGGIWIGSNGEFARTFFVDRGAAFLAVNAMGRAGIDKFWNAKLSRTSIPSELTPHLNQQFAENLSSPDRKRRLDALFPQRSLGQLNDALYLERVRQFISNGLRLVSMHALPKTPFLDSQWIAVIRSLPRRNKLANWWHRYAIGKLMPSLLDFPFDATGVPMGKNPGIRYWLGLSAHSANVPYFDYAAFFKEPRFRDAISQAAPFTQDLFPASLLQESLSPRTMAYLGAIAIFQQLVHEPTLAGTPDQPSAGKQS